MQIIDLIDNLIKYVLERFGRRLSERSYADAYARTYQNVLWDMVLGRNTF